MPPSLTRRLDAARGGEEEEEVEEEVGSVVEVRVEEGVRLSLEEEEEEGAADDWLADAEVVDEESLSDFCWILEKLSNSSWRRLKSGAMKRLDGS